MMVNFVAWEATWGEVLTFDQLKMGGWKMLNGCYLHKGEEEIVDPVLLHCSRIVMLW